MNKIKNASYIPVFTVNAYNSEPSRRDAFGNLSQFLNACVESYSSISLTIWYHRLFTAPAVFSGTAPFGPQKSLYTPNYSQQP